jgi:RimJ/RimL family protein N-acetyltransferase
LLDVRHEIVSRQKGNQLFEHAGDRQGDFIGQIDFFVINKQLRWANLGYNIHNQYRNQGYATEAAQLGLKIAFKDLNFHRIEAATELRNKPSQKVALKSGLLREGKRIKFLPDDGGIDMVVFGQNAIDYR